MQLKDENHWLRTSLGSIIQYQARDGKRERTQYISITRAKQRGSIQQRELELNAYFFFFFNGGGTFYLFSV
jgi:hypothetical protein